MISSNSLSGNSCCLSVLIKSNYSFTEKYGNEQWRILNTFSIFWGNSPVAFLLITWQLTDIEPALWPAMVTWLGSPPKAAMFLFTHFKARSWSFRPLLPGITPSSVVKNPVIVIWSLENSERFKMFSWLGKLTERSKAIVYSYYDDPIVHEIFGTTSFQRTKTTYETSSVDPK